VAVIGIGPRRQDELGADVSGVRGLRRLQTGVAVERGGRREAYRRSVPVGPGRGAVDRRVRHLLGPRRGRHRGPGSPMGNCARPAPMRPPPGPRRDRAGLGARPIRDSGRAARLTRPATSARPHGGHRPEPGRRRTGGAGGRDGGASAPTALVGNRCPGRRSGCSIRQGARRAAARGGPPRRGRPTGPTDTDPPADPVDRVRAIDVAQRATTPTSPPLSGRASSSRAGCRRWPVGAPTAGRTDEEERRAAALAASEFLRAQPSPISPQRGLGCARLVSREAP